MGSARNATFYGKTKRYFEKSEFVSIFILLRCNNNPRTFLMFQLLSIFWSPFYFACRK